MGIHVECVCWAVGTIDGVLSPQHGIDSGPLSPHILHHLLHQEWDVGIMDSILFQNLRSGNDAM